MTQAVKKVILKDSSVLLDLQHIFCDQKIDFQVPQKYQSVVQLLNDMYQNQLNFQMVRALSTANFSPYLVNFNSLFLQDLSDYMSNIVILNLSNCYAQSHSDKLNALLTKISTTLPALQFLSITHNGLD